MRIRAERTGNRYYPHFKVSMGLDSGEVFAGPVGTRERKEYGIMGETVQNAIVCARTGAQTGTPIVMTKRTFDLGGDQFVTREVPGQDAAYFSLVKPIIGAEYAVP
jgi:class 3 adenylate cyclase